MSRRKSKLDAKALKNDSEQQWAAFDDLLKGRIRISDSDRLKWDTESQRERAKLKTLQKKLKIKKDDDLIPVIINEALSAEEVMQIGNTLLDTFDPSSLDLTRKIDPAYMAFDHADRAPGVTDEQLDQWDLRIRSHLPSSLGLVTFDRVHKLLSVELAVDEANGDMLMKDDFQKNIEYKCFVPLMWFVEVMHPLPYLPEVKEMYFAVAKTIACNTSSDAFREVWKHVISVYSDCKQAIADYLWHAARLEGNGEEEQKEDKRAKQ